MKSRPKKSLSQKTILVISDLHISGGTKINGRKNVLEDFHADKELINFFKFYSTDDFKNKKIELILNGDFFDFLAIPFVNFFDDEFWSEKAALSKLKIILEAHPEVIMAINNFLQAPNKKITYILGNHDAEFSFKSVRDYLTSFIDKDVRDRFSFYLSNEYWPTKNILIKHGHEYEMAHDYDLKNSIKESERGELFFIPPWGTYYVTRIINKFKEERPFINSIRPIRTFIIYGLIFDTLFTIRFLSANIYYFFMVNILKYLQWRKKKIKIKTIVSYLFKEIQIFREYEDLTALEFERFPQLKILIVGHTHIPSITTFYEGATFINTGSWIKMFNLDFSKRQEGKKLTYAIIDINDYKEGHLNTTCGLNIWKDHTNNPYTDFY